METQTALVGTDGVVELDTVAGVHLYLSFIIDPRNAEGENTVGFDDALDDLRRFEFRMFVIHVLNGLENLLYSLQVFFLCRVLRLEAGHNLLCLHLICGLQLFNFPGGAAAKQVVHTMDG